MATSSTTILVLLTFTTLLFLIPIPPTNSAIPPRSISNAAETLLDAGYNKISQLLPFIANLSSHPVATLFAPPDSSFITSLKAVQPSLSQLQILICPRLYSIADLSSFPIGYRLPTLSNNSLLVTSPSIDTRVSLNGVTVNFTPESGPGPLYKDLYLNVYRVEDFFKLDYHLSNNVTMHQCHFAKGNVNGSYQDAAEAMRARGYNRMAGYLDMQLSQYFQQQEESDDNVITVFAPNDNAMEGYFGNSSEVGVGSVFLRHVVGCGMSRGYMMAFDDKEELSLETLLNGFEIKIGKDSKGNLVINGNVTVDAPEIYNGGRVIVHGLDAVVPTPYD